MKCTIPEISWHNRDPVLSIDIQPARKDNSPHRLASGGSDTHVLIWYVCMQDSGVATVEFAADLQRHQRAVNVVRFSPSGEFLASGDDESAIIIWKQKTDQDAPELPGMESEANKEHWLTVRMLRGHVEDVYDLSWSHDSAHLISGSVDNTAILWDMHKGRNLGILSDHSGFVQGVSWDPKNQYVATLSSDRTCRVYSIATKKAISRVSKARLPVPDGSELDGKVVRLFHDDTLKSFFRRLSFSPDGEILVAPSGLIEMPSSNTSCNATYIFTRNVLNRPVVYLPSPDQYTVAVRFCPLLFELHEGECMFALPYRMVLAIATQSSVVLYDTQQAEPFGIISNIHYTRLTDMSWSSDGRILIVSSTDGYCSIITFAAGELGQIYQPKDESSQGTSDDAVTEEVAQCKDLKSEDAGKPMMGQRSTDVKSELSPARKPVKRICPISLSKSSNKSTPSSDSIPAKAKNTISIDLSENMLIDSANSLGVCFPTSKKLEEKSLPQDVADDTGSGNCSKASIDGSSDNVKDNKIVAETLHLEAEVERKEILETISSTDVESEHNHKTNSKSTVSNAIRLETSVESGVIHESSDKTVSVNVTTSESSSGSKSVTPNCSLEGKCSNESLAQSKPSDVNSRERQTRIEAMETDNGDLPCSSTLNETDGVQFQETSQITTPDNATARDSTNEREREAVSSHSTETSKGGEVFHNAAAADNNVRQEITSTADISSVMVNHKSAEVTSKCQDASQNLLGECNDVSFRDTAEHFVEGRERSGNVTLANTDSPASSRTTSPQHGNETKKEVTHTTPCKTTEQEEMDVDKNSQLSPPRAKEKPCNITPTQQGKRTPRRVQFITLASPKSKKQLL